MFVCVCDCVSMCLYVAKQSVSLLKSASYMFFPLPRSPPPTYQILSPPPSPHSSPSRAEDDSRLLTGLTFSYEFVDLKFDEDPRRNVDDLNIFINQTEALVRRIIKFAKKESLFQVSVTDRVLECFRKVSLSMTKYFRCVTTSEKVSHAVYGVKKRDM